MSVFDTNNGRENHTKSLAYLDPNGGPTIQRFDIMKYPQIGRMAKTHRGFFWQPEEVAILKDASDFRALSPHEQFIFTSNLKRQIILDSVQGRAPTAAFNPVSSLPEIEFWNVHWTFFESIHSYSYTHVIQNVYADPSSVFNSMLDIKEIVDCAKDISKHYDRLIEMAKWYELLGEGTHVIYPQPRGESDEHFEPKVVRVTLRELKKALWLSLMSVNVLEGIRFYVSFSCSWAFAETKRMEGNAKIIKLICKDENLHLAFTQTMLKLLPRDDPDFISISEECREESIQLFRDAVDQEKAWASYLFKDGSLIGLNEKLLTDYVEYIADRRLTAVGLPTLYGNKQTNPLPWTQRWISGAEVQVANQESEGSQYIVGAVKQDVKADTFKGFSL